jgi:hypothetical protein
MVGGSALLLCTAGFVQVTLVTSYHVFALYSVKQKTDSSFQRTVHFCSAVSS